MKRMMNCLMGYKLIPEAVRRGHDKVDYRFEMQRQFIHVILGIFLINIILFLPYYESILLAGLVVLGTISFLQTKGLKIPIIHNVLRLFERDDERSGIRARGLLFFLLGSFLVSLLFSKSIALASIAILTFADSTSHLFWPFGRIKNPLNNKKVLEGAIGGGIIGGIAASVFVPIIIACSVSLIVMFLEAVELKYKHIIIDDNLVIPLVSAILISLGFMLL